MLPLVASRQRLLTKGVSVSLGRFTALVGIVLAAACLAPAAGASPGSIAATKQRATAIAAQIDAQGERLSIADERYNEAAVRRQQLDVSVAQAQASAAAAEKRWAVLRKRLDDHVKMLYMHPGAPLAAWLSMRSLTEDGRARVLSDSVLTSDSTLVSQTDRARRDVLAKADELSGLRADAQRNLDAMASERTAVASALTEQRALLAGVKGDLAKMIAAERQSELAAAEQQAAAAAKAAAAPSAPTASDTGGDMSPSPSSLPPPPPPSPAAATALDVARAQIGKPYQWAAAGPDSFDCSGLTMYAWGKAGVSLPHSAAAQYDMLPKVSRADLAPGDLVFFGSPIHHVGIYEGGGIMIDAPQTGENVRRDAIDRADYAGAARP
jgi:cell wall-associated NlpC family hydrolase